MDKVVRETERVSECLLRLMLIKDSKEIKRKFVGHLNTTFQQMKYLLEHFKIVLLDNLAFLKW